jgi:hypothetical protein
MKDSETGNDTWIDTSNQSTRDLYRKWWEESNTRAYEIFSRCGIDNASVRTDEDYVKPLLKLFKQR